MAVLVIVSTVGLLADDRTLLGESVWVKPLKFGIGLAIYSTTLAWMLGFLRRGHRFAWWTGTAFAIAGAVDVAAVVYAASLGTFSHFNNGTDPVAQIVQAAFSIGIMPLLIASFVIAVIVIVQRRDDRTIALAIRAGLTLAVASMVSALALSTTAGSTPRLVSDSNDRLVPLVGGHGIGDPDGNGMFVTDWSATGGDLRVPHFVGLHGLQVLLIVAFALNLLSRRIGMLQHEGVRTRLVGAIALGYAGIFVLLVWQAARGQSVVSPDAATAVTAGLIAVLTASLIYLIVRAARRSTATLANLHS
ncbi:hypothetical protein VD659_11635 [Herbiconiux sp. 11R-BC]|uniref:hypothetical protein n=1 Tax=Herbiconiux sp. 11R-BC TaxID=3111637 RepID=UPI003C0C47D2